jgi:thiol-disulfide isomerase/thioredoxin
MPLKKYMWVLLVFPWHFSHAQLKNDSVFSAATLASVPLIDAAAGQTVSVSSGPGLRLFVFLSPDCPICQGYTRTLNQLNQQYAGQLKVYGVIPGKTWKASDIIAFAAKYHISYPLWMDRSLGLSHYLQASTTPEVILLTTGNVLVYKGAIDNWYTSLGRSRNKPTQNYLQDAIDQALRHAHPVIKRTTPVGCLINDF